MTQECKIAELGMLDMLFEMKNPLTNIRLCLELLESGTNEHDPSVYYNIIKKSSLDIESTIKDLCNSFKEFGLSLHISLEEPGNLLDSGE